MIGRSSWVPAYSDSGHGERGRVRAGLGANDHWAWDTRSGGRMHCGRSVNYRDGRHGWIAYLVKCDLLIQNFTLGYRLYKNRFSLNLYTLNPMNR
jgi:hypothetical protein